MNIKEFKDVSIRGRVAFAIMCCERYINKKYPGRNWKPICDLMWKICDDSDYIDQSANHYMEIIPEYLFEFENYKDGDFEYISEVEFNNFRNIIDKEDKELNKIMHSIYDIAMEYAYCAVDKEAKNTYNYLKDVENIMVNKSICTPNICDLKKYKFEEFDGWGSTFDGRYLSMFC